MCSFNGDFKQSVHRMRRGLAPPLLRSLTQIFSKKQSLPPGLFVTALLLLLFVNALFQHLGCNPVPCVPVRCYEVFHFQAVVVLHMAEILFSLHCSLANLVPSSF